MIQIPDGAGIPFALSIKEPWLWAILHAGKRIENRNYPPSRSVMIQVIALHASKKFDDDGFRFLRRRGIQPPANELLPGHIMGLARVAGFVQHSSDPWFTGPYGWKLEEVTALPHPLLARGSLGLWTVTHALQGKIIDQLIGGGEDGLSGLNKLDAGAATEAAK